VDERGEDSDSGSKGNEFEENDSFDEELEDDQHL
jgi:hypothetical protein